MHTVLAGSNHLSVDFYSAYLNLLQVEHEHYNSIAVAVKRASINNDIINVFLILETREDFLSYSKLKDSLNENSQNIVLICFDDKVVKMATSPKLVIFNHRELTIDFSGTLAKMQVCKPYMHEEAKQRTPEKVMEHIKFMLLKGKISLPIKSECAINMLSSLEGDDISFKMIGEIASGDPVLHSGIIKMSNSVYFSGAYNTISDIEKALVRVGLSNVKVYLINFINKSLAANTELIFSDEIVASAEKSLKVASLAYVLADCFKVASPVTMFSVGLMSLLGEIFIYAAISDYFAGDEIQGGKPNGYVSLAEKNGPQVGGMLLKKWKFSDEYFIPIINGPKLRSNSYMNETRIIYLSICFTEFMDSGVIDDRAKAAMDKCGICLESEHLTKIRNDAIEHHKVVMSILS